MELGVRTECVFGQTLEEKMRVLKDLGYDFLELPLRDNEIDSMDEHYIQSICTLSNNVGFPIKSTSMSIWKFVSQHNSLERQKIITRVMKMIDLSDRCGANVILLATCEDIPFNEYVDVYSKELKRPADYAKDRGIILALEHVGPFKPSILEKLVRAINHDAVKVYFDIGNSIYQGEDPVEQIKRMGDIIAQIHIKGIRSRTPELESIPLSKMPLAEIREALCTHNYRGRGCLEIPAEKENNDHLREALTILRKFGY